MARAFLAASGHETEMAGMPFEKCGSWTKSIGKSNRLAIETAEALSQIAVLVAALQQGRHADGEIGHENIARCTSRMSKSVGIEPEKAGSAA